MSEAVEAFGLTLRSQGVDSTRGLGHSIFIRKSEEAVYLRKFGKLLDSLEDSPCVEYVHLDFCVYWFPYDQLWFIANHEVWWEDIYFERRSRVGSSPHFVVWHNIVVFSVPTRFRGEFFVPVPPAWKFLKPSSRFNVSSPSVLS